MCAPYSFWDIDNTQPVLERQQEVLTIEMIRQAYQHLTRAMDYSIAYESKETYDEWWNRTNLLQEIVDMELP